MSYEVQCECGKKLAVSSTDAGSTISCACGRSVDVPALHMLRVSAGEHGVSPELLLRSLLLERKLPDTDKCQSFGEPTKATIDALVDCERSETHVGGREATGCIPIGFFGVLVTYRARRAETRGRDVWFRIPVRCCPGCEPHVTNSGLRELLLQHPVCAGVLEKYPHARVARSR